MPSYRIELSTTSRAGCTDAVCKDQGVKILKGELRLGTWVEMVEGHGGWKWKHWGCVSGLVIQNIRDAISKGEDEDYAWDAIDGYDELEARPDIQEKIRRVIKQGHIDPKDFNGDPEHNILGSRGIRGGKKKTAEKDGDEEKADTKPAKGKAPKKPAGTKRGRKQAVDDEETEDAGSPQPPKKKVATSKKAAPAVDDEETGGAASPEPSKKAAKAKRAAPASEPAKKTGQAAKGKRGAKKPAAAKEEPEPEVPTKSKRGKKAKGKGAAREAPAAPEEQENSGLRTRGKAKRESLSTVATDDQKDAAPIKATKKRGRKSAA